jgi:hypothetical protein
MKTKRSYTSEDAIHVNSMDEFGQVIREHGHLVRVASAVRLANCSRGRFYQLIEYGCFRKFFVMGDLHISEREFFLWCERRQAVAAAEDLLPLGPLDQRSSSVRVSVAA